MVDLGRAAAGRRVSKNGDQEVWTRKLAGGGLAVGLFNLGAKEATISLKWADVGIHGHARVRDLWLHKDVPADGGPEYSARVPGHGVVMLRVSQ